MAKAVGAVDQPDRPLLDSLLYMLRDKQLLLVLDNCEHLLEACAQLAETLLAETGITILATSRQRTAARGCDGGR